jgi:Flp pilus assembly protein TadG
MALSIMLLVLLVFGITEFGRAMYTKNTLTNAARAGARAAVVTPALIPAGTDNALDCSSTDSVQKAICISMASINSNNVTFKVSDTSGNSPAKTNDTIDVTVTLMDYQSVVPKLISLPSTLTGEASMRYE